MTTLASQLAGADRFVDAARVVCEYCQQLGIDRTQVVLELASGAPALIVDGGASERDEPRFTAALVGPSRPFGAVRCWHRAAMSAALERELALAATHLSVWCARRGIEAVPDLPVHDRLGPRQREVARLAARGRTNDEIAEELGISINTVKGQLKQVFERLGVRNRTELVAVLARLAPTDGVAPGVTRLATVTVTCAVQRKR